MTWRRYKLEWILTYRDGSTSEGTSECKAESEAAAIAQVSKKPGTVKVTKVSDLGECDPPCDIACNVPPRRTN